MSSPSSLFHKLFAPLAAFRPLYRSLCGHRAYGLLYQDLLIETPEVAEALKRLPVKEQVLRCRRLKVASDLSLKQTLLPKEEWTKAEEDVFYLTPYLKEVFQEKRDREAFRL